MRNLRFIGGLVASLSPVGTVRADIPPPPPPPPTIPGTGATLPGAMPVVLVGTLLSLAIVVIGLAILRKRGGTGKFARAWVVVPATVVSIATAGAAVWVAIEHAAHAAQAARERANWRPNGPPPESVPVPPPAISPPVEKGQSPDPDPTGADK